VAADGSVPAVMVVALEPAVKVAHLMLSAAGVEALRPGRRPNLPGDPWRPRELGNRGSRSPHSESRLRLGKLR
jgi:hypothetical protein